MERSTSFPQITVHIQRKINMEKPTIPITEKENTKIHIENRKSNLDYTIYEGKQLEGKIQIVIKSGQTVYKNGKLNAEKGSGKYLV